MMNDKERGTSTLTLFEINSKIIILRQKMWSVGIDITKKHFGNGPWLVGLDFIGLDCESPLTKIT